MKRFSFFLFLLLTGVISIRLSAATYTSDGQWKVIEEQQLNGVTTKLKLRENPSLNVSNWISIEIENTTSQTLLIEDASYAIECKVYDKKNGKLIKQGKITSYSASELLDKALDSPFPIIELSPGISSSSKYPSTIGSVFLSVPESPVVFVEATLKLNIRLSGPDNLVFNWEDIPFNFEWARPQPVEFSDLYQQLLQLLEHPVSSSLHHFELLALLKVPEISKGIESSTLLQALKKRTGKEDGRLAILYHLNDHFNDNQELLDYYFELLKAKDQVALTDLFSAPDIWDDRFLEPLIEQYQNANLGHMHRVMDVLFTHQKSWLKKKGIPAVLSDLILFNYERFVYEDPADLSRRELFTSSLLIDMLGKTGNKEVIPIICPFLDEKERILDTGLVLDPNSMELPRPMRVCDNALEALMRLNNIDIIKAYKKAKFKPPYENGEAEIIISRIRDNMIKDLKKKGRACR